MCHLYQINTTGYTLETEKSGQAVCPYDPQHNSTAVFVGKFIAFFSNFSTFCPLLYFLGKITFIRNVKYKKNLYESRGH